jgi:hypothetical protein
MPLVDPIRRSITLKFVYYGPTGVGKTASLKLLEQRLHRGPRSGSSAGAGAGPGGRRPGRLLCLDTVEGRTLFFEILSIDLGARRDPRLDTRLLLRLFSVPGGDMHRHTRRLLLRGADGIMLVGGESAGASSRHRDNGSLGELRSNLRESGIGLDSLPILTQPSPGHSDGETLVIESLLALLESAWPAVVQVQRDAGLPVCHLPQLLETLRISLGLGVDAPVQAPLSRPAPALWKAPELPNQVRVMP